MSEERSAGGVVFCGDRVLVLRNFRGEYIFPKGHFEPGESAQDAARREVNEEAGLLPAIVARLEDTSYSYRLSNGAWRNKRVSWFLMENEAEAVAVDGEEIKWGEFVTWEEAMRLLTHDLDRATLQKAREIRTRQGGRS